MRAIGFGAIVAAAVAVASMAAAAAAPVERRYPALFGTQEVRSEQILLFPKWTGALSRFAASRDDATPSCAASGQVGCRVQEWRHMVDGLGGVDRRSQIETVNRTVNRVGYLVDPANYGVEDYWATPQQFLNRDGDCEDYAIAKFLALRALGFANDDLRIVVLRDVNLRVAHAVLVVYLDGEALVLDNQVQGVVRAEAIRHYQPIYSLNETSWWLHRPPEAAAPRLALRVGR